MQKLFLWALQLMKLLFMVTTLTVGSICFFLMSVEFNNEKNQQNKLNAIMIHLIIYKTKFFCKIWFQKKCEFSLNNSL